MSNKEKEKTVIVKKKKPLNFILMKTTPTINKTH